MPVSITETADPNKGELWITLDQLERRQISISSMCSKHLYKSFFKVSRIFKLTNGEKYSTTQFTCRVDIKETSTFMINLLSFTKNVVGINFCVFTDDEEVQKVELNNEQPTRLINKESQIEVEASTTFYQKFKLQPYYYVFSFAIFFEKTNAKKVDLFLKLGSVSECTFEEVIFEDETWSQCLKSRICNLSCKNFLYIFTTVFCVFCYIFYLAQ